jgi:hypothetical protein
MFQPSSGSRWIVDPRAQKVSFLLPNKCLSQNVLGDIAVLLINSLTRLCAGHVLGGLKPCFVLGVGDGRTKEIALKSCVETRVSERLIAKAFDINPLGLHIAWVLSRPEWMIELQQSLK